MRTRSRAEMRYSWPLRSNPSAATAGNPSPGLTYTSTALPTASLRLSYTVRCTSSLRKGISIAWRWRVSAFSLLERTERAHSRPKKLVHAHAAALHKLGEQAGHKFAGGGL